MPDALHRRDERDSLLRTPRDVAMPQIQKGNARHARNAVYKASKARRDVGKTRDLAVVGGADQVIFRPALQRLQALVLLALRLPLFSSAVFFLGLAMGTQSAKNNVRQLDFALTAFGFCFSPRDRCESSSGKISILKPDICGLKTRFTKLPQCTPKKIVPAISTSFSRIVFHGSLPSMRDVEIRPILSLGRATPRDYFQARSVSTPFIVDYERYGPKKGRSQCNSLKHLFAFCTITSLIPRSRPR